MASGTIDSWAGKALALKGDKQMLTILILAVFMQVKKNNKAKTQQRKAITPSIPRKFQQPGQLPSSILDHPRNSWQADEKGF